jgi:hypothetical protein
MQRLDRSLAEWIGLTLVAVGGSCVDAPLVMAASAACPAGQIAATRIEYEGKYNPGPTMDLVNLPELAAKVGYTRRTVLVASGYYKEASEGTIVAMKDQPPGTPVPMPGVKLFARELPSRFVIIETAQQRLVFDERGDPDRLGTRRTKSKQLSAAEERAAADALQAALAPAAGNVKVLGKATYAGIPCEVRQNLVPGNSVCIATIDGQYVTLAEEMQVPHRSWIRAKSKADICVTKQEFEPPAHVRFK